MGLDSALVSIVFCFVSYLRLSASDVVLKWVMRAEVQEINVLLIVSTWGLLFLLAIYLKLVLGYLRCVVVAG